MNTLFKNIDIVTMDEDLGVIYDGCVLTSDGKISYVGKEAPEGILVQKVIYGRGKLLMPGLVNAHTHLPMTAMRGYADDAKLDDWLHNYIFPVEEKWDAKSIGICAQMGMAEAISSGTTSFSDMYFFCDAIADAAKQAGMCANLSRGLTCKDAFDADSHEGWQETLELMDKWHNHDGGRIKIDLSVHAEYTSNRDLWEQVAALAADRDLGVHFHLSETQAEHESAKKKYGATPAELFERAGLLTEKSLAAHCVWVEERDMEILAAKGVSIAHCPISNLKLGSGMAPIVKLQNAGINVAIGTDGVASNNSQDMFEEMKTASLIQKGVHLDPTLLPAYSTLAMATLNGAKAQGRSSSGKIKVGMDADLIVLNTASPSLTPMHEPHSGIVYAARGSDVELTMVRGKALYEDREFKTIDFEKLRYEFFGSVVKKLFI